MSTFWQTTKGYFAVITGFIACPCHLPLTFSLLVGLTAGTAFGAWLENNVLLVAVLSTVYFAAAIAAGMKWLGQDKPMLARHTGQPSVQLVTSEGCEPCEEAKANWRGAPERYAFDLKEVNIASTSERDLATTTSSPRRPQWWTTL